MLKCVNTAGIKLNQKIIDLGIGCFINNIYYLWVLPGTLEVQGSGTALL